MNSTNSKLKKTNIISQKTYDKVDNIWDLLSNNAQVLIKNIFNETELYENMALKNAYENDPDFKNKFKSKLDNEKKKAMWEIEKDDEDEIENIDELLLKV